MNSLDDRLQPITETLFTHLLGTETGQRAAAIAQPTALLKRHGGDQLARFGDMSFPLDVQSWRPAVQLPAKSTVRVIFDLRGGDDGAIADVERCLDELRDALLHTCVQTVSIVQNRCVLQLNRVRFFECLPAVLAAGDNFGRTAPLPGCLVNVVLAHGTDWANDELLVLPGDDKQRLQQLTITEYRVWMLRQVLLRLIGYSKFTVSERADTQLLVTHKSTQPAELHPDAATPVQRVRIVICGVVKEGQQMSGMRASEYLGIRQQHMEQMAQHKCDIAPQNAATIAALSRQLAAAAVTVDLLEVKHSSPVQLAVQQHSGGASRGAAFILYNSARIEQLLRTYADRLATGEYEAAPATADVDWSVLREPDEWQLMFGYVMEWPDVVRRALGTVELGQVAPHLVCTFLSGLARCFSVYYRRVRILDFNRKHLMSTLHSRMRLVMAVRIVLNQALAILDIAPVQRM